MIKPGKKHSTPLGLHRRAGCINWHLYMGRGGHVANVGSQRSFSPPTNALFLFYILLPSPFLLLLYWISFFQLLCWLPFGFFPRHFYQTFLTKDCWWWPPCFQIQAPLLGPHSFDLWAALDNDHFFLVESLHDWVFMTSSSLGSSTYQTAHLASPLEEVVHHFSPCLLVFLRNSFLGSDILSLYLILW